MVRLKEKTLTLNIEICQFYQYSLEFYGHVFGPSGVSPDPKKVAAIKDAGAPKNQEEVHSLLGLITYCSRFIPDLATVSKPLPQLTTTSVP